MSHFSLYAIKVTLINYFQKLSTDFFSEKNLLKQGQLSLKKHESLIRKPMDVSDDIFMLFERINIPNLLLIELSFVGLFNPQETLNKLKKMLEQMIPIIDTYAFIADIEETKLQKMKKELILIVKMIFFLRHFEGILDSDARITIETDEAFYQDLIAISHDLIKTENSLCFSFNGKDLSLNAFLEDYIRNLSSEIYMQNTEAASSFEKEITETQMSDLIMPSLTNIFNTLLIGYFLSIIKGFTEIKSPEEAIASLKTESHKIFSQTGYIEVNAKEVVA